MTLRSHPACATCGAPAFDRCDQCDRWLCLACGLLTATLSFACRPATAAVPSATCHVRV